MIAGGGVIGSAIAWRLAQRGVSVTLTDAGNLGGEASPASAGMLAPGSEFENSSVWSELGADSMKSYPAFVQELQAETGLNVDFQICGCQIVGGPFYPSDGIVDPAAMLRALRCACEKRNVRITPERVSTIETQEYGAVVIAAGAWSSQIRVTHGGRLVSLPGVVPIKGHLLGFQLEPGALGPVLRHDEAYLLQRSNGFLIAGSNEQDIGFDQTLDTASCEDIHRRAARLFPPLERAAPVKRWIGFRPRPVEGEGPYIRRVEGTNVWVAYGHYRNGVLLTPVTAQRVAAGIASAP